MLQKKTIYYKKYRKLLKFSILKILFLYNKKQLTKKLTEILHFYDNKKIKFCHFDPVFANFM